MSFAFGEVTKRETFAGCVIDVFEAMMVFKHKIEKFTIIFDRNRNGNGRV